MAAVLQIQRHLHQQPYTQQPSSTRRRFKRLTIPFPRFALASGGCFDPNPNTQTTTQTRVSQPVAR